MPLESMNEVTFVVRLGSFTSVRAERRRAAGLPVLIALGDVEERQVDPAAKRLERPDNQYADSPDHRFPYVLTTYRLTEHHTAGGMSRYLSHLAELQPEFFV